MPTLNYFHTRCFRNVYAYLLRSPSKTQILLLTSYRLELQKAVQ